MQNCSKSIANALELLQSCPNQLKKCNRLGISRGNIYMTYTKPKHHIFDAGDMRKTPCLWGLLYRWQAKHRKVHDFGYGRLTGTSWMNYDAIMVTHALAPWVSRVAVSMTLTMYEERVLSWWRHQMETFSALLALCAGNSPVIGEFPSQRPVTRGFDVFFDLCLTKWLSKQSRGWWFDTPSQSLWRHCNVAFHDGGSRQP